MTTCTAIYHLDMLSDSMCHQSDTMVHAVISALMKSRQEDCFEFKTQWGYIVPSQPGLQRKLLQKRGKKKQQKNIKHKNTGNLRTAKRGLVGKVF